MWSAGPVSREVPVSTTTLQLPDGQMPSDWPPTCLCARAHVRVCVRSCVYVCARVCMCVRAPMFVCARVCSRVCARAYVRVCAHAYVWPPTYPPTLTSCRSSSQYSSLLTSTASSEPRYREGSGSPWKVRGHHHFEAKKHSTTEKEWWHSTVQLDKRTHTRTKTMADCCTGS